MSIAIAHLGVYSEMPDSINRVFITGLLSADPVCHGEGPVVLFDDRCEGPLVSNDSKVT